MLSPDDPDYPKNMLDYANRKNIVPPVLYYKGDISLLKNKTLTVIGSRDCAEYFLKTSANLAEKFARQGVNILSGLALGCDTYAHMGALKAKGKAIGVLAHGLSDSVFYPKQNLELAHEILENGGLLISAYPPTKRATKATFVERDFVQAALGDATLVITSTVRGGTMYAAKETYKIDKPLYALYPYDCLREYDTQVSGNEVLFRFYDAKSILDYIPEEEENESYILKIFSE